MKMDNLPDPIQFIAENGPMTSRQCAQLLPALTQKNVDDKLRQAFRVGKLSRRIDEESRTNRPSYVYFDANGRSSNKEPEHCTILRTLGKHQETEIGIY
jgi:hypothetical protein